MNIEFHSSTTLHLSVKPSIKSWSIFFGIISIGVGAAYYSPDDHPLMKFGYLFGCLILGLNFLDDWEDCVIDQIQKKITLTRRNWLEILTSRCTSSKTLVLDTSSVMGVRVSPFKKSKYQVELVLRNGSIIPISETTSSNKSHEEMVANCVLRILGLDRVETLYGHFDDSDDDNQSISTASNVENLQRSFYTEYDELKVEDEVNNGGVGNLDENAEDEESSELSSEESDNLNASSTDEDGFEYF